MRNLIWQYHIDTNRAYDGPYRKKMAMASSSLASFYAMKYATEYHMACFSKWFTKGTHGGPAMERFQLLEERYDVYDYILYLDTDILISTDAPNIFDQFSNVDVAGISMPHSADLALLENGWLSNEFPNKQRYIDSYANGAILMLSKPFRKYLRDNLNVEDIEIDKIPYRNKDKANIKWPVYDKSMVCFHLAKSPFNLIKLDDCWHRGPYFYNFGGQKNDERIKKFFRDYENLRTQWIPS